MACPSSEAHTTMVSPLRGDGSPHRGAAERDGVASVASRRRKERTYPGGARHGSRSRWSPKASNHRDTFVRVRRWRTS